MSSLSNNSSIQESWLQIVKSKVEAMRFGSVQIIVHEGRVTQVESTEKTRLSSGVNGETAPSRISLRA
jgi:hypothetical protein